MMQRTTRLETLLAKQKQLEKKIRSARMREKIKEKENALQQRILVGSFFLQKYRFTEISKLMDSEGFLDSARKRDLMEIADNNSCDKM